MMSATHVSAVRILGAALLALLFAMPVPAEEGEAVPATTPMPMGGPGPMPPAGMSPGAMGMGPGMPPPMMRSRWEMQQAHMERMERHMANIERLLEALVEAQRKGD
ncbi:MULTISPECIES: hypothetical protein [unclassified Marichromatium]|uniref:hypothetical protein n=2 Tax=Marichromatium TaxID=85076 RepID=UPI0011CD7D40|nr:hypothetical protein [Marichromatium sp. AB32]MBO8084493.1 hypothetical protein [Marichromatium sp.]